MTKPIEQTDLSSEKSPEIVRKIDSDQLFQGKKLLVIQHAGEDYRLILTRNNRLILQK